MSLGLYIELFLVAVGAALFVGTGLALLAYRRTGAFPGQPVADEDGRHVTPSVGTAIVKTVVGALLLLVGVAGLATG